MPVRAQQLQREIRRGMLEGDDDYRHICRCYRCDLQRQGRFTHAGRTRKQVQFLVESAQQLSELNEPRGHAEHGAAGCLPLQAALLGWCAAR